ncbi:MAG: hypothetical protein AB1505_02650 [Candidatus Latescibacterota bacterium]
MDEIGWTCRMRLDGTTLALLAAALLATAGAAQANRILLNANYAVRRVGGNNTRTLGVSVGGRRGRGGPGGSAT